MTLRMDLLDKNISGEHCGLVVRLSDSRSRGHGLEPHLHQVESLSKTLTLPNVPEHVDFVLMSHD